MSEIKIDIGNGEGELVSIELPDSISVGQTIEVSGESGTLLVINACIVESNKLYRDESWLRIHLLLLSLVIIEIGRVIYAILFQRLSKHVRYLVSVYLTRLSYKMWLAH